MKSYKSTAEYIAHAPASVRKHLTKMRLEIRSVVPKETTESIKYGMPTFELNGNLVHFAAMKNHLGFYPTPSAIKAFQKELKDYSTSKGCVRFLYDTPLPFALIKKMVKFRVKENLKSK